MRRIPPTFQRPYRVRSVGCPGFTLVELLVAIAVLAILVGWAVPSLRSLVERNAVVSTANDVLSSALLARSEAVRRERTVWLQYEKNKQRLSVYADDGDGVLDTGQDATVLLEDFAQRDVTLTAEGNIATLKYDARGRANVDPSGDYFVVERGDSKRYVCFSAAGRPRVQENRCA